MPFVSYATFPLPAFKMYVNVSPPKIINKQIVSHVSFKSILQFVTLDLLQEKLVCSSQYIVEKRL